MVGREHRDTMSNNSDGNKDLIELSRLLYDERKSLENGVVDQSRRQVGSSEGGRRFERRSGQDAEMSGSVSGARQALRQQTASSQAITVCWERFLHTRSLKVLLVENDDCTRHIIAALLHNCCYEVVEAANGLQAWKVLEDVNNRIDIVLTEVLLPCFSGVALLCKIMSHRTRKNIPVIMMSSHDSMGVVFNCLSKGAVDFLVKPLRKNELKNLWQHVWRKCRSSSESGSSSATYTKKSVKFRSADKSDNESGSNDEENNESPSQNFGDESDHGSGTQNSWTKQAVEDQIENPRHVSPMKEISKCPDSTCAQVIHPNIKPFEEKVASMSATKECEEQKEQPVKSEVDKTLIANLPKSQDTLRKSPVEVPVELSSMHPSSMPNLDSSQLSIPVINGMGLNSDNPTTELNTKGAGVNHESADQNKETKESDTNKYSRIPTVDVNTVDHGQELPFPDQSLKRARDRDTQESGKNVQDDRNVLKRSVSSAFSRYDAALHSKISSTDARSPSPLENGLDRKLETINKMQSYSGSNIPNQGSNGGSVYRDMASTSNNNYNHSETVQHVHPPVAHSLNNDLAPDQPMHDSHEYKAATNLCVQPESTHQELQIQPGHHLDHKHQAADISQPQHQPPNHDNLLPTKVVRSSQHCQSSYMMGGHIESTAGNYTSLNGSGLGSNHGSNGQNGSSSAANVGGMNMENYDGVGCENGSGDASGGGSGSGSRSRSGNKLDPDKLAQREAALTKFRQKRKELCFTRKVRYQSRKKLAEQRPRIRGQFVKQTLPESTIKDPTESQT